MAKRVTQKMAMRKRRMYKRRQYKRRFIPRSLPQGKMLLKRTFYSGLLQFSSASTSGFWNYQTFALSMLPSYNELTTLFDEYKICGIKVTFRPAYDSIQLPNAAGSVTQPQAYAHVLINPESTLIPSGTYSSTTLNTFLENSGVKTYTLNKPFSFFFKPKASDGLEGGSTSSRLIKSGYIKTTSNAVTYRGYHIFLQQNNFVSTNTNISLDTFVTYYIALRNPR